MNFDYIESDQEFRDLAASLDQCAESRGGCDNCPLFQDCRQQFDYLATRALDKGLKHSDRLAFEDKFKNLKKQVVMF